MDASGRRVKEGGGLTTKTVKEIGQFFMLIFHIHIAEALISQDSQN